MVETFISSVQWLTYLLCLREGALALMPPLNPIKKQEALSITCNWKKNAVSIYYRSVPHFTD